ncbi:tigger transposable element-derived protein 6-like [Melanaphis sacchari]|uniref:tigger transposable element-derived protein 6-like n=1 Tax=Melanaphis sacchari TaxID=742174 RepID=UPI000DC14832|nr:tigger transposable element-derived protein 6-like [Melanaphis sacchari]
MTNASTSSSSAGVKRKALSIYEKLNIIKLYGEKIGVFNKQQIADQLGLPTYSLRTILKNKKEIEKTRFHEIRKSENYSLEDIYSADEFGLFFKLMSDKSLVLKDKTCHGGKLSKDWLTFLTCSNKSGTDKLKLLVIAQNHAWMTGSLFIEWVQQLNCKFVKQKRKVLLFVDNCPTHPKDITLTNIKLVFFPPNATSKLQPLD